MSQATEREGAMRAEVLADRGEGPPLVYLPGIDGTGQFLFDLADRLADRYRLIQLRYATPQPGRAEADSYPGLAASVAGHLRERCDRPALLLSESFGGAVALQTAIDHPDCVAGLLLVNSFAHFQRRAGLMMSRAVAPLLPASVFRVSRRAVAQRFFFGARHDPAAMQRFRVIPDVRFGAGYRRRLAMIQRLDLRPHLAEITAPVALYAGDRDAIVAAPIEAREMAARLPNATIEILPGGGHVVLPLAEEPWLERVADLAVRAKLR